MGLEMMSFRVCLREGFGLGKLGVVIYKIGWVGLGSVVNNFDWFRVNVWVMEILELMVFLSKGVIDYFGD